MILGRERSWVRSRKRQNQAWIFSKVILKRRSSRWFGRKHREQREQRHSAFVRIFEARTRYFQMNNFGQNEELAFGRQRQKPT